MKSLFFLLFIPFTNAPISYRQLTWADFKGKPTNDHLASTCSGIVIEKDTAYAVFEPDKSWTRTTDVATLRHEQLHFTITAYWADFISKEHRLKPPLSAHSIDQILQHWSDMEEQYDKETDNGRDLAAQKKWEQRIIFY